MGKLNQPHALVVMTNGDVYYLTTEDTDRLERCAREKIEFYHTIDAKSGSKIRVRVMYVSSIVEGGSRNG